MKRTKQPVTQPQPTAQRSSRTSTKGKRFTSDYIPYDEAMRVGTQELSKGKRPVIGLYIILSVNMGLRVGDMLRLTHRDIAGLKTGQHLVITEHKTKKRREVTINDKIKHAHAYYIKQYGKGLDHAEPIFKSQKGTVYATESLNGILKAMFAHTGLPHISTHSLRKSFGRRVWEMNGETEKALTQLSQLLNHASPQTTRIYLGINRDELDELILNL